MISNPTLAAFTSATSTSPLRAGSAHASANRGRCNRRLMATGLAAALVSAAGLASAAVAPSDPARSNAGDATLVREVLAHAIHYPNSREARHLRLQGALELWVDIDRDGTLRDAGIEKASTSVLLDREALRAVRTARFPSLTGEGTAGATRRFIVPVEFASNAAR